MQAKSSVWVYLTRTVGLGLWCAAMIAFTPNLAVAHELWIETQPSAQTGADHQIEVCWGHAGTRSGGPALAAMTGQISASITAPDGTVSPLTLATRDNCYAGHAPLNAPGFHPISAVLEAGIVDRKVHDIPAKSRIVMCGRACVHAGQNDAGLANVTGSNLEPILLSNPEVLRPGRAVIARILLKGKPLTNRIAFAALGTAGPWPQASDATTDAHQWTIQATSDPKSGEVRLPLIAAGRHILLVRYFDETPGRYEGELDFGSDFSHLRRGDAYDRTMYVSTVSFDVKTE